MELDNRPPFLEASPHKRHSRQCARLAPTRYGTNSLRQPATASSKKI